MDGSSQRFIFFAWIQSPIIFIIHVFFFRFLIFWGVYPVARGFEYCHFGYGCYNTFNLKITFLARAFTMLSSYFNALHDSLLNLFTRVKFLEIYLTSSDNNFWKFSFTFNCWHHLIHVEYFLCWNETLDVQLLQLLNTSLHVSSYFPSLDNGFSGKKSQVPIFLCCLVKALKIHSKYFLSHVREKRIGKRWTVYFHIGSITNKLKSFSDLFRTNVPFISMASSIYSNWFCRTLFRDVLGTLSDI